MKKKQLKIEPSQRPNNMRTRERIYKEMDDFYERSKDSNVLTYGNTGIIIELLLDIREKLYGNKN